MFTYVCLGTNDAVLGALELSRCDISGEPDWEGWVGWGTYKDQYIKEVALWLGKPFDGKAAIAGNSLTIALRAKSWQAVKAFYSADLTYEQKRNFFFSQLNPTLNISKRVSTLGKLDRLL